MTTISSFAPVARADARVLVLGSMPGVRSLQAQQYYAHPQNAFWRIMGSVCGFDHGLAYQQRLQALMDCGIALWDVLGRCRREGSLDAAIQAAELEPNDFRSFLAEHGRVKAVCFNGATAQRIWRRKIEPELPVPMLPPTRVRLPSTSPAYAAMRFDDKLKAWSQIRAMLAA